MAKFTIRVVETTTQEFEVEADTPEAALEAAEEVFCNTEADGFTFISSDDRSYSLSEA